MMQEIIERINAFRVGCKSQEAVVLSEFLLLIADRVAALEQSVAKWLKADAEMKVIAKKWSEPAADAGLMARMGRAISALLLYRAALKAGRDGDEGGFELIGKAREACGGNADHAWKFAEVVLAEYAAAVDERKANV